MMPDRQQMIEKAERMIGRMTTLPTIPEVTIRVSSLLDNPDCILDEVADAILTDQVMASRVIKIVNSPLFKPMHEIQSLKRALIYLGFRRIREIALTCSIIKAFESDGVFDVKTFWRHSFGVGIVSKIIAQRIRYPEVEKAYICGIVHDIGEVFLSNYMQKDFNRIVEMLKGTSNCFRTVEAEILGTTHCEIGLSLAKRWNFPADYCDVIGNHHDPADAMLDPALVAIVHLADLFCSVRDLDYGGREWVSFNLAEEPAWEMLGAWSRHLSDFDVERFCFELDERVEEIHDLVESIFEGVVA